MYKGGDYEMTFQIASYDYLDANGSFVSCMIGCNCFWNK